MGFLVVNAVLTPPAQGGRKAVSYSAGAMAGAERRTKIMVKLDVRSHFFAPELREFATDLVELADAMDKANK